jgi:hypothetical protein
MLLRTRLVSGAAILAAIGLFLVATIGLSDMGSRFAGLAMLAMLAGGVSLTQGLALAGFRSGAVYAKSSRQSGLDQAV